MMNFVHSLLTPFRIWIVSFLVALVVGAIPTYGEPITTLALLIALRWVYGRYLVRHRSKNEHIYDDSEQMSIVNHISTDTSSTIADCCTTSSSSSNILMSSSNMNDDRSIASAASSSREGTLNDIIFSDEDDHMPPYYQDIAWQGNSPSFDNHPSQQKRQPSVVLWDEPTLRIDLIEHYVSSSSINDDEDVEKQQPHTTEKPTSNIDAMASTTILASASTDVSTTMPPPPPSPFKKKNYRRLFFLDNLKLFLIFLLVTVHVACAFGASDMFYFTLGAYSSRFQKASGLAVGLLQAFGVSLFFFIVGYLVPAAYERKGREVFMLKRAGNLLVPAMVGCMIVVPGSVIIGQAMGGLPIFAFPHPGHFWCSFWLLLLTWMYVSLYDSTTMLAPFAMPNIPPTALRMVAGWWICGASMFLVILMYQVSGGNTFFASMPLTIGSLTCNVFMFYMGVVGYRNSWLERSIRDQLDISIGWLRLIVLCEAVLLVLLFPITPSFANEIQLHSISEVALSLGTFFVAGVFCLDMSIVVLDFFQQHVDFEHPVSRGLLDNAHIVYVIHPLVISFLCWAFVAFYNYYIAIYGVSKLAFQTSAFDYYFHEYAISKSVFVGPGNGGLTLFMAFQCVLILTHILVWPMARILRKYLAGQKTKLNILILVLLPSPAF